jgi:DNA-binding transcriptional LysR family regulator
MGRATIAQLEAFCLVVDLGSVRRAAERLHLTQPTVSLRLRQLQATLPCPVFEPHGRGIRLTQAGHEFLVKARPVLDAYTAMSSGREPAAVAGTLRIGLAEGFAVACLPALIPALARAHPRLRPEWTVTTSAALERSLIDAALDLAVLVDPVGDRALRLLPLGSQRNVWAASARLPVRARPAPRDLQRFTVVTTLPGTSMHRHTVAWFAARELEPGPMCLCTSVNAAAQLVGAGMGIGVFPARMVEAHPMGGGLVALQARPALPPGRVYVVDRAGDDQSRTEAVMRVMTSVTRELDYFGDA